MDISAWLRGLGLERYEEAFRENAIDEAILPKLTAEDLRDLGVTAVGHRRILLDAIAVSRAETFRDTTEHSVEPDRSGAKAPEAERRQLTVMFADLVGSTALSARLDPEELRDIIGAYHRRCAEVITRSGGFVAKYLGDGVLAYFGYPQAHEEDAEQAVRAGLALIEAVAKLDAGQATSLQVRVGIATGLVVVGDLLGEGAAQEQAVIGETPNLAARLQGLAERNTVVIADNTRRLLGGLFDYRDLGTLPVAGIGYPVHVWRVVGASLVGSRFEALRAASTPLIGREEEIALLTRRWERAKTGDGSVVLIVGEPGIGKSRIAQTLLEQLGDEPHTRLRYFCSPHHQHSALYPSITQLEQAAGFRREDTAETRLDKLVAVLALANKELSEAVPLLADLLSIPTGDRYPPLNLTPQKRKQKTLHVQVAQVEGLAARQPLLMLWEDIHWSDPTTLESLDLLIDRAATLRVLMILTFRPEFTPPWVGRPHVTLLSLNRLAPRQSAEMIIRVNGGKALPKEIFQQIIDRTDGVPLFIEELTKSVLESGIVTKDGDDGYTVTGPVVPLAIPMTLHASLLARLDRLAPVQEVAQIGAALGRRFSHELISAVAAMPQPQLEDALAQLIRAELIFRRGAPPDAEYTFKHALVQDAAYGTLLRRSRRALHRRIAETLETQFPEAATAQPEVLAQHYAEAGLKEQAVAYLQRAGARALERSAYLEAISHLARGLELLEASPDSTERAQRELELQLALGSALMATRGYAAPEVEQAYVRARALCSHIGLTPQLFPVLHGLYRIYHVRGDLIAAREVGEHLTELGQSLGDQTLLVEAHRALGVPLLWLGEVALARAKLEEGITLYDAKLVRSHAYTYGIDPGVVCLSYAALAWWFLGFADHALDRSQRALALAEELSHPHSRALALVWAAWLRQFRREVPSTQELAQAAIRLCSEHGYPLWRPMGAILHGWALSESGQKPEECIAQMRQGLADLRATGAGLWQPCFLALIAEVCDKANRIDEGLTVLAQGLGIVRDRAERFYEAELHRLRGELLLRCNPANVSACETCFRTALAIARNQQARSLELRAATSLARLWAERGERRNAQDLLTGICGWFTEGFDTLDLQEARALLSELGDHGLN
jgi:class 3 adenylate cyclase/predicted ATPase